MSLMEADHASHELFSGEALWRHPAPGTTVLWDFWQKAMAKSDAINEDFLSLYEWSINDSQAFWSFVWEFVGIKASKRFEKVTTNPNIMFPRPSFFPGARLNFAENLLFPPNLTLDPDTTPALISATETTRSLLTWSQLRERVRRVRNSLTHLDVRAGDRVAGYVCNHADAVVFMLAATSLGAVWTAISPDSGVSMVLDRLGQIEPKVLVADTKSEYNGKVHDVASKVREVVASLPSLCGVVLLGTHGSPSHTSSVKGATKSRVFSVDEFWKLDESDDALAFEQLFPDHPIYILYSSGTTGAPKCIIHGAIGTLVQHKKEHILHGDLRPGERIFYFTTCTWMMWHWLISALACGATLVLYDGSPMRYKPNSDLTLASPSSQPDDLAMPRFVDELNIHQFGTSAKYLSLLEQKALKPRLPPHNIKMSSLRTIYNTASPLAPSTFRYVYDAGVFGPGVHLASITGGTDIVSLFGAGNPLLPVRAGEVQAPGLGMAIRSFDPETGEDITAKSVPGDLVCTKPFPSQPVAFWPLDSDAGASKYKAAYFERFYDPLSGRPVWHHGDFVAFRPGHAGDDMGIIMLGRSDGVLNPAGVRFGSAEIYNVLLKLFPGVVQDSICVGRRREGEADESVCLFARMEDGRPFDDELRDRIKREIRSELSPRHVPAVVEACDDIPVTVNGKKVEKAVKQILSGATEIKTSASVANPDSLSFFRKWAEAHRDG